MAQINGAVKIQTKEVFLSDQKVTADQAQSVIPKGYRLATLEEITLRYRHDADFREELWHNGPAWTSQKGLESFSFQKISESGKYSDIGEEFYKKLPFEERSEHFPGKGPVAVDGGDYLSAANRRLGVDAIFSQSLKARVAYVKEESEAEPTLREVVVDALRNRAELTLTQ